MHRILSTLLVLFSASFLPAQAPMPAKSSSEIQHMIKGLQVMGRVLYIAAHPDDENQRLIAYFAQGQGYETAYLSLTRGDGGQNLIGDEKGASLGVLRTQELLAARRIDGGQQFFTRAYDFGYSKTPEETLTKWDKTELLRDMVWIIRSFRPDVMITRFATPEKGGGGHGQHTTSAIVAREAFSLAADPTAFPEQLAYVATWQPSRLMWNNYWGFRRQNPTEEELKDVISINIGAFDPLLGKSYGEIASEARSMHRCQAFGAALLRGSLKEYLAYELGTKPENDDLFSGIETSWSRVGLPEVGDLLAQAFLNFDATDPTKSLPLLLQVKQLIDTNPNAWVADKRRDLDQVILYCAGIWMEATTARPMIAVGDSIAYQVEILKRSSIEARVVTIARDDKIDTLHVALEDNGAVQRWDFSAPGKATPDAQDAIYPISQPYWLSNPHPVGLYEVSNTQWVGRPENPVSLHIAVTFDIRGVILRTELPIVHRYVDRAVGELYRPLVITPPLTANLAESAYLFADNLPKTVKIQTQGYRKGTYRLTFEAPAGWQFSPEELTVAIDHPGQELPLSVLVTPPMLKSKGTLRVIIHAEGMDPYSLGHETVSYDHIPTQTWFPPATSHLVRIDLQKRGERIAYLMGSGDEIPEALREIGYQVDLLQPNTLTAEQLKPYDAVIAGVRSYNTQERMPYLQRQILDYVEQGGTYLVQYNTSFDMKESNPGPYQLELGRERITVEEAELRFLDPAHPAFHFPNKISDQDLEGWVQERGLYFAEKWDERYQPLLAGHDPGEKELEGALLVAKYGEGHFIYTGLSFFRQLPAGVPGAFRLFVNLLSLGYDKE